MGAGGAACGCAIKTPAFWVEAPAFRPGENMGK
jgi:hypothetical protein